MAPASSGASRRASRSRSADSSRTSSRRRAFPCCAGSRSRSAPATNPHRLPGLLGGHSNSLQFGARPVAVRRHRSVFVRGWIGFDALIIYSPFSFRSTSPPAWRWAGQLAGCGAHVRRHALRPDAVARRGAAASLLFFDISVASTKVRRGAKDELPPADTWAPLRKRPRAAGELVRGAAAGGLRGGERRRPRARPAAAGRSRGRGHVAAEGRCRSTTLSRFQRRDAGTVRFTARQRRGRDRVSSFRAWSTTRSPRASSGR